MSDPNLSSPLSQPLRPASRAGLFVAILALVAAGLAVYFGFARPVAPRRLKLALLTWTEDPFWQPLIRGAQECADKSNVELTVIRSKPTVEAQNRHIRELLDSGVDGIAISPNDAAAQLAILNEAASKIPVVTFDSDAPESKRRRFIGIDNYAAGRSAADEVREAMPDGGPILITVGSATMQHGRDRRQGLIDGLLERGFDRNRAPIRSMANSKARNTRSSPPSPTAPTPPRPSSTSLLRSKLIPKSKAWSDSSATAHRRAGGDEAGRPGGPVKRRRL